MRQPIRIIFACVAALMLASCVSAPTITSNYDHQADFSSYHSFSFFVPFGIDEAGYESLVSQTLKSAARSEMEARGYTYTETGGDLLINFNARLQQKTNISQVPVAPMIGFRRGFYGGWNGYETQVDQYKEGTVKLDLVDAERKQLVWEGVAVARVTSKQTQNRDAALTAAVTQMFAKYPFTAGK